MKNIGVLLAMSMAAMSEGLFKYSNTYFQSSSNFDMKQINKAHKKNRARKKK